MKGMRAGALGLSATCLLHLCYQEMAQIIRFLFSCFLQVDKIKIKLPYQDILSCVFCVYVSACMGALVNVARLISWGWQRFRVN